MTALMADFPSSAVVLDRDDRIAAHSKRASRLLRRSPDVLQRATLATFIVRDDREPLDALLQTARAQPGFAVSAQLRLARRGGADVRLTVQAQTIDAEPLTDYTVVRLDGVDIAAVDAHSDFVGAQLAVHELITAMAPAEQVYDAIARMVDSQLNATCCIAAYVGSDGAYRLAVESAPGNEPAMGRAIAVERPVADLSRRLFAVVTDDDTDDAAQLLRSLEHDGLASSPRMHHTITASTDGRPLGAVLVVGSADTPVGTTARELLRIAARLAGLAIERDRDDRWLTQQTLFDPLTGLPRRSLVVDRAEQAFRVHQENGTPLSFIFLKLSEFHAINSAYGHLMGDEVLRSCTERLVGLIPDGDTIGRFAGEDFVVLTTCTNPVALAEQLLDALTVPLELSDGNEVHLQVRIGVASPGDDDTADSVLRNAHAAMQWSKQPAAQNVVMFERSMRTTGMERLRLRNDLRKCIGRGELIVHFQPKVSMRTGRISGAEALLRWQHAEHGLLRPDRFITIAEESDVMVDIGSWVLEKSVSDAARWRDQGLIGDDFLLAVNMSAVQLWSDSFFDNVRETLERHSWNPQALSLELTETQLVSDYDELLRSLVRVKDMGVLLAADDFGTGYSALSYLDKLPLDVLKVDKGFVARIGPDGSGSVVATGVISMAKQLGLRTCAEGVETADQLNGLRQLGCDWAQGYYIARPLPEGAFASLAAGEPTWR